MRAARAGAAVTWLYAAGFGGFTIPVSIYLRQRGRLPTFFDLFEMYGGPWSSRYDDGTFIWLLLAFLLATLAAAVTGWSLWNHSKRGGVLNLALLPVEAIFWIGFALPLPWIIGFVRISLVAAAWRTLR